MKKLKKLLVQGDTIFAESFMETQRNLSPVRSRPWVVFCTASKFSLHFFIRTIKVFPIVLAHTNSFAYFVHAPQLTEQRIVDTRSLVRCKYWKRHQRGNLCHLDPSIEIDYDDAGERDNIIFEK